MGRRVHTFPLRIPLDVWGEARTLHFNHQLSLNLLFVEMIQFAHVHPTFLQKLEELKPKNKAGHFVFISDWR